MKNEMHIGNLLIQPIDSRLPPLLSMEVATYRQYADFNALLCLLLFDLRRLNALLLSLWQIARQNQR